MSHLNAYRNRCNVLVVEPRPLLGALMMYVLKSIGLRGVGVYACGRCALHALDESEECVSAALVSTGLRDGGAFELASELLGRGIPVAFMAREHHAIPWEHREAPVIRLPYDVSDVDAALRPLIESPLRLQLPAF